MLIKKEKYQIEQLDNGIVRTEIFSFHDFDEHDLHEITSVYTDQLKITAGYFLVVIGGHITHETNLFVDFSDPVRNRIRKAEAIVSRDLLNWTKTDFYKKVFHVDHPMKFFMEESEAESWLLHLMD